MTLVCVIVAVVGNNGVGKSTFLKLLIGELDMVSAGLQGLHTFPLQMRTLDLPYELFSF